MNGILEIPVGGQPPGTDPRRDQTAGAGLGGFLAGPENRLVDVAIRSVLADPHVPSQPRYSPLFLYGPSGTGKSHLARGLFVAWRGHFPHRRAEYTTAIDFARELTDAVATHAVEEMRTCYRKATLLVIEDVGCLAVKQPERQREKLAAQEELLHTLDAVVRSGGQVVVTASAAPAELPGLSPGLQARLTAGLAVPLAPPGPETRLEIVRRLAMLRQIPLPEPAAQALADGLSVTVPELDGALQQMAASTRFEGRPIDAHTVRDFLSQRTDPPKPRLPEIASSATRFFSVRLADLRGPSRRQAVVTARDVAMYLARQLTSASLAQIGRYFGGRDHTTVMHGCRKTEGLLKTDPNIRLAVEHLQHKWRNT